MNLDLDDTEKAALVELPADSVERDRFPLSPRVKRLPSILAKLGVGSATGMPHYPPPKPPGERSNRVGKEAAAVRAMPGKRCASMHAKPSVAASRAEQPDDLGKNSGRSDRNSVARRSDETEDHAQRTGNPGNVG